MSLGVKGPEKGLERGINHDGNDGVFDETTGGATKDILARAFQNGLWYDPVTQKNYYQFSIDANQAGSKDQLSLDNIRIFSSHTPISSFNYGNFVTNPNDPLTKPSADSVLIWALDSGSYNNTASLPYHNGSGKYEASVYLPATMFTAAIAANDYIYFYTELGGLSGYGGNDGNEEWAVNVGAGIVPEPCEYGLVGVLGLVSLAVYERRKAQKARKAA
jgi:hypothetical protein